MFTSEQKKFHCAVLLQKRRIVLFNTSSFRGISTKVSGLSRHLQRRVKKNQKSFFDITVINHKCETALPTFKLI
jgi:actin-related protein